MRCARLKGRTRKCVNVSRKALSLAGNGAKPERRDGFLCAWIPPALRARRNALQAKPPCTDRDASRLAMARRGTSRARRNVRNRGSGSLHAMRGGLACRSWHADRKV